MLSVQAPMRPIPCECRQPILSQESAPPTLIVLHREEVICSTDDKAQSALPGGHIALQLVDELGPFQIVAAEIIQSRSQSQMQCALVNRLVRELDITCTTYCRPGTST